MHYMIIMNYRYHTCAADAEGRHAMGITTTSLCGMLASDNLPPTQPVVTTCSLITQEGIIMGNLYFLIAGALWVQWILHAFSYSKLTSQPVEIVHSRTE